MYFKKLYDKICIEGKNKKQLYESKLYDMHKHHILPTHNGGEDTEENFTYVSIREHIICHYLLWKIYKMPNDLRSMKMLGAKLTSNQRRIVGLWCKENKIGYHSDEVRHENGKNTYKKQKNEYEKTGIKNFYYWSTPEGRSERAKIAGNKSWEKTKQSRQLPYFISDDPKQRSLNASKASKASPKKPATNGVITIKFHTDLERNAYIAANPDFKIGAHYLRCKRNRKKKNN